MFKKHIFATGAALLFCSSGAFADAFTFDPTGTAGSIGNISGVGSFDQSPGNALAVNGGGVLAANQKITTLYQANLANANSATNTSQSLFANGAGGANFTFVAGYSETVALAVPALGIAVFAFDPTGVNFFKMYKTTTAGNNLTGAGFTSSTVVLSGHFIADGFTSNYQQSVSSPNQAFDQFANNDYPNFTSIVGGGSTVLTAVIDSFDANYFPDLIGGSTFGFVNTSQITPFKQVDPSQAFINLTGTASAVTAPHLGAQNGGSAGGPDFQLQADANTSFTRVPEPDSLLLLGLGLGLIGWIGKRRSRKEA